MEQRLETAFLVDTIGLRCVDDTRMILRSFSSLLLPLQPRIADPKFPEATRLAIDSRGFPCSSPACIRNHVPPYTASTAASPTQTEPKYQAKDEKNAKAKKKIKNKTQYFSLLESIYYNDWYLSFVSGKSVVFKS